MKKQVFTSLLLAVILSLSACITSTKITGSWVDPTVKQQPKNIKSIFIATLSRKIEFRTKLENALAAQTELHHIKAVKSADFFSPEFYQNKPTKEALLSKIQQTDVDAILTVSVIHKESESRYVRGTTGYYPYPAFGWYGSFYRYYNYWYPSFNDPGYYVTDKIYFLETNLYDAKTEKLIWSAQSETWNPSSVDSFVEKYPVLVLNQMTKDGLISPLSP